MQRGKNRATGYTDFYKGTSRTAPGRDPMIKHETEKEEEETDPRKLAIMRRLNRNKSRKVGS